MRRAGRVSPLILLVILGVVVLVVVLFMGQESPSAAGSRFMSALAKGDPEALAKNSFVSGKSQEELLESWKFATGVAGKHYMFRWKISSSRVVDDRSATVRMQVEKNFGPGSYEENFDLPLEKVDGKWKVDAGGISREMYPGLPRPGKESGNASPAS
jgi:hypothetical protein